MRGGGRRTITVHVAYVREGAGHAMIGASQPARQLPGLVGRLAEAFQVVVTGLLLAVLPGGGRCAGSSSRAWPGEAAGPGCWTGLSLRPSGRLDRRSR